ncbi:hypothetical protein GCM10012319_33820 [Comamonas sp. KCTC 72670]|nr:hypothetical protein GCM10012319_33820 [Comamonas sp. KCTC 72670]
MGGTRVVDDTFLRTGARDEREADEQHALGTENGRHIERLSLIQADFVRRGVSVGIDVRRTEVIIPSSIAAAMGPS